MKYFLLIFSLLLLTKLDAQSDSVMITELAPFNDGLFLSHKDHRYNTSIPKENIITSINKDQVDFYNKLTSTPKIEYLVGGKTFTVESVNVWGFVQNKTLFVNYKGVFYRVPVFGSISYFAGIVEVTGYYTGVYDPMYGMGAGRAVRTKELNEFLLSYYDGQVMNFDIDELEKLLSKDEVVYKEYKSISKRKRRKQVTRFIRMYNDRHPVYYLK